MNLAGNDPEPLGLAFHHQGSTFINEKKAVTKMVIETGLIGLPY